MDFRDPKTQALIVRFLVGCVLAEIPILTALLNSMQPDWRYCAGALLGGVAAYLEKQYSPQLANVYLPPLGGPTAPSPLGVVPTPAPPVPPAA